jgi:C2 domain
MRLSIKILQAHLTHDTDFFTNMDPYVIVRVGSQNKRTRILDNAGKCPVWNEEFIFQISEYDNTFSVTVMDKDTFTADDMVGSATINLLQVKQRGGTMREWLYLDYRGRNAGRIEVDVQVIPEASTQINYMGSFMQGISGVSRGFMPIPGLTPVPIQPGAFGASFGPQSAPYTQPSPLINLQPPVYSPSPPAQNFNYPQPPSASGIGPVNQISAPTHQNPNQQIGNQQMSHALVSAGLVSPFLLAMMQNNQVPPNQNQYPPAGRQLPPGW